MTPSGKITTRIREKYLKGRKPASIVSDAILVILILMFLIPGTRAVLFRGAAGIRTWITRTDAPGGGEKLDATSWDWTMQDLQGRLIPFGSLKGEVIFLNQWATWCPPCRAELPSIERLYRTWGDRVKFVLLTAEDPQKVQEFLKKQGFDFPVYIGQVEGTRLAARTIPSTAIIGRDGRLVMRHDGALNWNARKIRRLIDRQASQR